MTTANETLDTLRTRLRSGAQTATHCLTLTLPDAQLRVCTDQPALARILSDYFAPCLTEAPSNKPPTLSLVALDGADTLGMGEQWEDWQREPGKTGRKDTIFDPAPDERWVYKVKTGMLFWQNADQPTALGPVTKHPNQIINFALTQYLNHCLNQGWQLGHCAALQIQNQGLAIAGLSGGGKSTLMLHLLEQGQAFVSNDRLLIRPDTRPGEFCMRGIPKWPRVNPGTLMHNPRLKPLLSDTAQAELAKLPGEALRSLEQKYDVEIERFYGPDFIRMETPLHALIVLNWSVDAAEPTRLRTTTLAQSPELLPALSKSPGPFFASIAASHKAGHFLKNGTQPDAQSYLNALGDLRCWVLEGQLNFDRATALILEALNA
jgi:HprK-related kinase B